MWRYSQNPIIKRYAIPTSNSIFNSAVVPFNGGFAGVFRCDTKSRLMRLNAGFSKDGISVFNVNKIYDERLRQAYDGEYTISPHPTPEGFDVISFTVDHLQKERNTIIGMVRSGKAKACVGSWQAACDARMAKLQREKEEKAAMGDL